MTERERVKTKDWKFRRGELRTSRARCMLEVARRHRGIAGESEDRARTCSATDPIGDDATGLAEGEEGRPPCPRARGQLPERVRPAAGDPRARSRAARSGTAAARGGAATGMNRRLARADRRQRTLIVLGKPVPIRARLGSRSPKPRSARRSSRAPAAGRRREHLAVRVASRTTPANERRRHARRSRRRSLGSPWRNSWCRRAGRHEEKPEAVRDVGNGVLGRQLSSPSTTPVASRWPGW